MGYMRWIENVTHLERCELSLGPKEVRDIGVCDYDWIHLAQDRDRWLAVMNTPMNIRISQTARNFLT
jgi:hypothetical protein